MDRVEVKLNVSTKNEGTAEPYWLILNPSQNLSCDPHVLGGMITGPFFSRESAQEHLDARRYAFGSRAVVYCCSGYWSREYKEAIRNAGGI